MTSLCLYKGFLQSIVASNPLASNGFKHFPVVLLEFMECNLVTCPIHQSTVVRLLYRVLELQIFQKKKKKKKFGWTLYWEFTLYLWKLFNVESGKQGRWFNALWPLFGLGLCTSTFNSVFGSIVTYQNFFKWLELLDFTHIGIRESHPWMLIWIFLALITSSLDNIYSNISPTLSVSGKHKSRFSLN